MADHDGALLLERPAADARPDALDVAAAVAPHLVVAAHLEGGPEPLVSGAGGGAHTLLAELVGVVGQLGAEEGATGAREADVDEGLASCHGGNVPAAGAHEVNVA